MVGSLGFRCVFSVGIGRHPRPRFRSYRLCGLACPHMRRYLGARMHVSMSASRVPPFPVRRVRAPTAQAASAGEAPCIMSGAHLWQGWAQEGLPPCRGGNIVCYSRGRLHECGPCRPTPPGSACIACALAALRCEEGGGAMASSSSDSMGMPSAVSLCACDGG